MEMMIEENMLDGIELNHPRNDEKEGLERLILAGKAANKAYYEAHK